MTPSLRSASGIAALSRLLRAPTLLAFDFDGTLAPICADPCKARTDVGWSRRLRSIAKRWPVAVISGRALDDLTTRLEFEPAFVAGN